MAVTLTIPTPLRRYCGGNRQLAVHGATVSDVLKDAAKQHPAILRFIVDDGGRLHSWIRIYSGEEDVAVLEGLDTPVADGELVHVIPCILD